jgi:hypothetical protein
LGGGVDAAQLFGELEGPFGLAAVGEEAAGLPAQRVTIMPPSLLRSVLGYEQVLSEVDVELYAGPGADAAAAGSLTLESAAQHGGAWAG